MWGFFVFKKLTFVLMCGITGITLFSENDLRFLKQIQPATQTLHQRGPDCQAIFEHQNTALGHARLSVNDTSESANQPFLDETSRYTIVFNGEIYNYRQLYNEINIKGTTNSDCEIIIHLYNFIYCISNSYIPIIPMIYMKSHIFI